MIEPNPYSPVESTRCAASSFCLLLLALTGIALMVCSGASAGERSSPNDPSLNGVFAFAQTFAVPPPGPRAVDGPETDPGASASLGLAGNGEYAHASSVRQAFQVLVPHIFWTRRGQGTQGSIARAESDGSSPEVEFVPIEPFSPGPVGVAADSGHLYWTNAKDGTIGRVEVGGGSPEPEFVKGAGEPFGVAVSSEYIYWASEKAIGRAAIDGSSVEPEFISHIDGACGIAVDAEHVYWAAERSIGRADIDGSAPDPDFVTGAREACGVAVDAEHVFWANAQNGTIGRADIDGSSPDQSFIQGAGQTFGVAVDGSYIYWTSSKAEEIGRAQIDGSSVEPDFITGAGAALGIAVSSRSGPTISSTATPTAVVGEYIHDTMTLSGGSSPTGQINFRLYGPGDETCSGQPLVEDPENISGEGTYRSVDVAYGVPGVYRWTVAYSGDEHNEAVESPCNAEGESSTVTKAAPTISSAASGPVILGEAIHDTATLAGGLSPTGQITFQAYGPEDATCATTPAFTEAVTVSGAGPYTSPAFTPTAPGTYRWTATYSGNAENEVAAAGCNAEGESSTVTKATPTVSTSASGPTVVGGPIHDTATISGGSSPTGQVTFRAYGPGDETCATTPAFTEAVTVTGVGSYPSGEFTPSQAGTYRWTAVYSGDADNEEVVSACNAANESSTVTKAPPTISSSATATAVLGEAIHDTATLTGGYSPTGQITFRAYGPEDATCATTPAFTEAVTVSGSGTYTSPAFTPTAPGTYRWTASYSGDANDEVATAGCNAEGESSSVTKATPTISTAASGPVALGGRIHDTATISGGYSPTGQVTFRVYEPGDETCSSTPPFVEAVAVSGDGSYPSGEFTPSKVGTYRWTATYSGDAGNDEVVSACNAEGESSTVDKAIPVLTSVASGPAVVGNPIHDVVTVSGGVSPSGQITIRAYGPGDESCSAAPVFVEAVAVSGDGSYPSGEFTPSKVGTYRWTAAYSGDVDNEVVVSGCNAPNESSTVTKATPRISTAASGPVALGAAISDTAVIAGGVSPTGQIVFRVFGPGDAACSTTPAFTDAVTVSGNGSYPSSEFTPSQPGTYSWTAAYSGDVDNEVVVSGCNAANESSTVGRASSSVDLRATPNPSLLGGVVTLTAEVDGETPTGTVEFKDGGGLIGISPLDPQGVATLSVSSLASGSHPLSATYSGDADDLPSNSSTVIVEITVPPPPPPPTSPSASPPPSSPPPVSAPPAEPRVHLRRDPGRRPRYLFVFADQAPGLIYLCRLDAVPFRHCSSPVVYRNLKPGRHVFRVRAVDESGLESATRTVRLLVKKVRRREVSAPE